jgi:integrase
MTPKQAFEVLLNTPKPRRTLRLSDAATALRVSELLGLMWKDLDFEGSVIDVRRAYVWGRFKVVLWNVVAREGVEPPTPAFSGLRSTT